MKLLGVDAFNLLFGKTPSGITGGLESAALGSALALGARLGGGVDAARHWRPIAGAAVASAIAGALIPVASGRLKGGSLAVLAQSFEGSRLQLDALGKLLGEGHFGYVAEITSGSVEGLLFGGGVVGLLYRYAACCLATIPYPMSYR